MMTCRKYYEGLHPRGRLILLLGVRRDVVEMLCGGEYLRGVLNTVVIGRDAVERLWEDC